MSPIYRRRRVRGIRPDDTHRIDPAPSNRQDRPRLGGRIERPLFLYPCHGQLRTRSWVVDHLTKLLGMLGSAHDGECAAGQASRRTSSSGSAGLTWNASTSSTRKSARLYEQCRAGKARPPTSSSPGSRASSRTCHHEIISMSKCIISKATPAEQVVLASDRTFFQQHPRRKFRLPPAFTVEIERLASAAARRLLLVGRHQTDRAGHPLPLAIRRTARPPDRGLGEHRARRVVNH